MMPPANGRATTRPPALRGALFGADGKLIAQNASHFSADVESQRTYWYLLG